MSDTFNFGAMLDALGPDLDKEIKKDVEGGSFTPIPEGQYRAVVAKTEMGNVSQAGNQQLLVTWKVVGGAQDGKTIRERIVFMKDMGEKYAPIFFRKWVARGVPLETFRLEPTPEQLGAMIVGRHAIITVKHEPGVNDPTKMFANVSWVSPDTGKTPADPAPRPATASGAFGGVPTASPAPTAATPPTVGAISIPRPDVPGMPAGL